MNFFDRIEDVADKSWLGVQILGAVLLVLTVLKED